MNDAATRMSVCVQSPCAWVKIEGRADFRSSEAFKKLVRGLARQGCSRFLLEFTRCIHMDSTFAGTLSGLGREFEKTRSASSTPSLCLLNANQRIADTLTNLGVIHLFPRLQQATPDATEFKPVEAAPPSPDQKEVARAMLEAHRTLVEINPANFEKFKDVLHYLAEDLKKLEGEPKAAAPLPEA